MIGDDLVVAGKVDGVLPVMLAGRLLGMLSLNDVARAITNRHRDKASHDGLDGVVTTLARIGEPREHAHAAE